MMVRCIRVPKPEGNPVRMELKAENMIFLVLNCHDLAIISS